MVCVGIWFRFVRWLVVWYDLMWFGVGFDCVWVFYVDVGKV